ncbi:MAG: YdeI/OmpD-associated family protein [Flavobacteriales bacterium]
MHVQEQINLFIAEQPEWQRKLLVRLRQLIHAADSDIEETWRSNAPCFERHGVVVSLHPLKTCVSVWFHKGDQLKDAHGLFKPNEKDAAREVRKYKLEEGDAINEKAFTDLLKQALKADRPARAEAKTRSAANLPDEFACVLEKDASTREQWESLTAEARQEFVEWVSDAKQEEARKRRVAKALELIRAGQHMGDAFKVS